MAEIAAAEERESGNADQSKQGSQNEQGGSDEYDNFVS